MNDILLLTIFAFLAALFGVAKDRHFGRIDATFVSISLVGLLGWIASLKGVGMEFSLTITPAEDMVIFNLILSGAMVLLPLIMTVNSLRRGNVSAVVAAGVLSVVGYVLLPNFIQSVLIFFPEPAKRFLTLSLFVAMLFFVGISSSKTVSRSEEEEVEE